MGVLIAPFVVVERPSDGIGWQCALRRVVSFAVACCKVGARLHDLIIVGFDALDEVCKRDNLACLF